MGGYDQPVNLAGTSPDLNIGGELEVVTRDMAYEGQSVASVDGKVLLIDNAIPGERVRVRIAGRKKGLWLADTVAVLDTSADRVEPRCRYVPECGGCQWQHISYERQLQLKEGIVRDQLRRIGHFEDPPVLPVIASPAPWFYRNHIRMMADSLGQLGFARRRSHEQIRIDECVVSEPGINRRLARLQGKATTPTVSFRASQATGETLIETPDLVDQVYHEELAGRTFRISAPSFFQINTHTAEIIVREIEKRLVPGPDDRLLDVYAGVGTFAAILGPLVKSVVAVEESPVAVADGMFNTLHVTNITYHQGSAEALLPGLKGPFDAAIVDPPRAGLKPPVIEYLVDHPVGRLVYASCDPSTLARDLRLLVAGGYTLGDVQPIDQFPQTYHVECVAGLRAK